MRIQWIAVVLLLVSGCASELTQPMPVYQPPEAASPQAQQKDMLECAALARQIMQGRYDYFGVQELRVRGQCLESRGWIAQTSSPTPSPGAGNRPAGYRTDYSDTRACEQQMLRQLRYYSGNVTGKDSPGWNQALVRYRIDRGLESEADALASMRRELGTEAPVACRN